VMVSVLAHRPNNTVALSLSKGASRFQPPLMAERRASTGSALRLFFEP
jgi:hypothetical protein